jgi:hypothetical protein
MLNATVLLMATLLPVLLAAAFLLGRYLRRRQELLDNELSPVTRQHIELFQGGQLNEAAVESAKTRFRDLLERGAVEEVEASLRPGIHYVVQVRALTELGTEDAGQILERQLGRRLTEDQLEQSWYWIDLANGLRALNRSQSLPPLLRCADSAGDIPLGHYLAAETVCFLGFAGYARETQTRLGRSALRVLHRALEGLRLGLQPHVIIEGRLGELIEGLWDNRSEKIDPLVVRIFSETLRVLRRAPHAELVLSAEMAEQEAFHWQVSRLTALQPALEDYLQESPELLCKLLPKARSDEERDILLALADLRAGAASTLLPRLDKRGFAHADLAVDVLLWSRDERVAPFLRDWAQRRVPMARRVQRQRRPMSPRRQPVPDDVPYQAILRALRGHGSPQTEKFLILAAKDWDPNYRAMALGSLGWWEPYQRSELLVLLQETRRDINPEVRHAARAALARLGERQALHWFRQMLLSEDGQRVHEAIQFVAAEGLVLLWPDLDRLADAEDTDIALHAREAMERLSEEMEYRGK